MQPALTPQSPLACLHSCLPAEWTGWPGFRGALQTAYRRAPVGGPARPRRPRQTAVMQPSATAMTASRSVRVGPAA